MRRLIVVLAVLVVLGIADLTTRAYAEGRIEAAVRARVEGVGSIDARIQSFPFVGRLLAFGDVPSLDIELRDVHGHGIDVASLEVEGEGIELNRRVLLGKRHVKITDVDEVTVTARLSESTVRAVTKADVRFTADRVTLSVAGRTVAARPTVVEGQLQLAVEGLPSVTVPIPDSALLPCTPDARVVHGAIELTCIADELPAIVVDAIGSAELRAQPGAP